MRIIYLSPDELTPYEKNPRYNDDAVEIVANSIREFGFKVPIVIDKDNIIVAGHTRHKASKHLGLEKVPCIRADDLTDEKIKAFRLADNKTAEFSTWDLELLGEELAGLTDLNMDQFGFDLDIEGSLSDMDIIDEEKYTRTINIPQYQITGEKPEINALFKTDRYLQLLQDIEESNLDEAEKEFLRLAASRHIVFNYKNIAEYYSHSTPEMQDLMEQSALVIIDYADAIKYGYTSLNEELLAMLDEDLEE